MRIDMAAILYLAACVFGGTLITREILDRGPAKGIGKNYIWTALAFSFGTGVLLTTWVLYFSAYLLHAGAGLSNPLLPANIIVFGILTGYIKSRIGYVGCAHVEFRFFLFQV